MKVYLELFAPFCNFDVSLEFFQSKRFEKAKQTENTDFQSCESCGGACETLQGPRNNWMCKGWGKAAPGKGKRSYR